MSRNIAPIGACGLRSELVVIYMDLRARALASLQRSLSVDVPRMSIETKTSIHLLRGSRMLYSVVRRTAQQSLCQYTPARCCLSALA